MSIQDEINRTKSQIDDHRSAIAKLEVHGRALALKLLGVEIGDRVRFIRRGKTFEAEVRGVDYWDWRPCLRAVKVKKDGTAGEQSTGYFDKWEKVATPPTGSE